MAEKNICSICGFDKNLPRKPVIIGKSVVAFSIYLDNKCKECGHQKDGSTIKNSKG